MDMDPNEAAALAEGRMDDGEIPELPADGPEPSAGAPDGSGGRSVVDGLLETEPAGSVRQYPDMPEWSAHALIGTQKFVNGLSGDDRVEGGKPAIVDFVQAGISVWTDLDTRSEPEPEADPSSDPEPGIGGEIPE